MANDAAAHAGCLLVGEYVDEAEAYRQQYGPDLPDGKPHALKLPRDAPELWLTAWRVLPPGAQQTSPHARFDITDWVPLDP